MKPLERALRILLRLSTHDRVTVQQLYRLFDERETPRSIQRTLDAIQSANIPLKVERGAHNTHYYSLQRAFDYIPQLLEMDEMLAALLLAPFAGLFERTRLGEDLHQAFEKMDHLVPENSIAFTSALRGLGESFMWQEPGQVKLDGRDELLPQLMRAVLEKRKCHVEYRARGAEETKQMTALPYALLFHSGSVYLVVNVPPHTNYVYLALQRIQSLEVTDEVFERSPDFVLKDYLKDHFGIWREDPVEVVLRFDRTVAPTIAERTWHPTQEIRHLSNGGLELRMKAGPSEELISWILRWGHFCEAVSPDSLRRNVHERLVRTVQQYEA